jgi:hypothetical protein
MRTLARRCISVAVVLAAAAGANAQVAWSNPFGTASFFDWANGQNSNSNLFGSPTLVGDTFIFFPVNFVANSVNGVPANATDTFSVDLLVHPGFKFDGISISELGDYTIQGEGSVAANATMTVADNLNVRNYVNPLAFNPAFPVFSGTNQSWNGSAMRDLAAAEGGTPFISIHLEVTNNLIAISTPGGSAVIRKTIVGVPVAVTILPEPGVLAMLGLGGLLAARRRRA